MPLVSYSSSSDGDDSDSDHAKSLAKPPSRAEADLLDCDARRPTSPMPPLPEVFHDLYAVTARKSTTDDSSLHQGRTRQVPHIAGQWPSHVYIEWRPNSEQHAALARLLAGIDKTLNGEIELHQFITSDLGAPQPLHVSLSRPLSLSTVEKEGFLTRITESLGSGSVPPFAIQPRSLAWFKSPDSNRCFLVLGVSTTDEHASNRELVELLQKSNAVAARFRQPLLYQLQDQEAARTAFHISIAWTLARPGQDLSTATLDSVRKLSLTEMMRWRIGVSSVKVKIGNSVTSIALSRQALSSEKTRFLFDES